MIIKQLKKRYKDFDNSYKKRFNNYASYAKPNVTKLKELGGVKSHIRLMLLRLMKHLLSIVTYVAIKRLSLRFVSQMLA